MCWVFDGGSRAILGHVNYIVCVCVRYLMEGAVLFSAMLIILCVCVCVLGI